MEKVFNVKVLLKLTTDGMVLSSSGFILMVSADFLDFTRFFFIFVGFASQINFVCRLGDRLIQSVCIFSSVFSTI